VTVLNVKEVFPTIQGEGPLAGVPAVFVRLAGCNLRCWFCDTDFDGGEPWTATQLMREVHQQGQYIGARPHKGLLAADPAPSPRPLVVLTGGEPLAQPIADLVWSAIRDGWRVQIETAGTLWTHLPESEHLDIVCSPKTPKLHPKARERVTAWKYLVRVTDRCDDDGLPISSTQDPERAGTGVPSKDSKLPLAKPNPGAPVYLQPVQEPGDPNNANTSEAVRRSMRFGYLLSLQQHKVVGLP